MNYEWYFLLPTFSLLNILMEVATISILANHQLLRETLLLVEKLVLLLLEEREDFVEEREPSSVERKTHKHSLFVISVIANVMLYVWHVVVIQLAMYRLGRL